MFLIHVEIILLFSWHGLRNTQGQTDPNAESKQNTNKKEEEK
jgi:hypothetical protein